MDGPRRGVEIGLGLALVAALALLVYTWAHDAIGPAPTGRPEPPAVAAAGPATLHAELRALHEELALERSLRESLSEELDGLREELAAARAKPETAPSGQTAAATRRGERASDVIGSFDPKALLAQGISERDVERIQRHYERLEMAELYARDQAVREGWDGSRRLTDELQALRGEARAEMGDEDYDCLLYATGQNNRVVLVKVLSDSPAQAAGLEDGDIVLRYDEHAIFVPGALRQATNEGRSGSLVALDFLRDGDSRRSWVPRGPLGAQLRSKRGPPQKRG